MTKYPQITDISLVIVTILT